MPVTYQTADQQTATGTGTPSVVKPTNLAQNDLVILAFFSNNEFTVSSIPADFAVIGSVGPLAVGNPRIQAWWKVAGASEPATYDFGALTGTTDWRLVSGRVTGYRLASGDPIDQLSTLADVGTLQTTTPVPGIDPAEINTLMLGYCVIRNNNNAITKPTEMTQIFTFAGAGGNPGAAGAIEALSGEAATGTRTWTHDSVRRAGMLFNIFSSPSEKRPSPVWRAQSMVPHHLLEA